MSYIAGSQSTSSTPDNEVKLGTLEGVDSRGWGGRGFGISNVFFFLHVKRGTKRSKQWRARHMKETFSIRALWLEGKGIGERGI